MAPRRQPNRLPFSSFFLAHTMEVLLSSSNWGSVGTGFPWTQFRTHTESRQLARFFCFFFFFFVASVCSPLCFFTDSKWEGESVAEAAAAAAATTFSSILSSFSSLSINRIGKEWTLGSACALALENCLFTLNVRACLPLSFSLAPVWVLTSFLLLFHLPFPSLLSCFLL